MHHLESLESRKLLADAGGGFAASTALSLEGRQSVSIEFTVPLSADPTLADVQLIDRSTAQPLAIPLTLNVATDRKVLTLGPADNSPFPDGQYLLRLDRFNLHDSAGDPLDFDLNYYFFILKGDLNRDGQVSINDFITLASNIGRSPVTHADGDINGDGRVSIDDFQQLSADFGKSFAASPIAIHLNAGGTDFTDSLARPFAAESDFLRGAAAQTLFDIPYSSDDPLFNAYHTGPDFSFSRPIENGNYTLWLEFAEPTFTQIGQRVFDVFAEGRQILDNYDIIQRAGFQTPIAQAFNINITDGSLDLAFRGVVGDAIVSSIVLLPNETPAFVKPYSFECAPDSALITQSVTNLRRIGFDILNYANDHKGHSPPDFPTLFAEAGEWFSAFFNPRTSTRMPRGELQLYEQQAMIGNLDDYIPRFVDRLVILPPDTPMAYENPDRTPGPINILFVDGHVATFDRAGASVVLGIPINDPSDPPPPRDFSKCNVNPAIPTSADNLRRLAHALLNYANDNRGTYPADPGSLYESQHTTLKITDFLNPRRDHEVPPPNMTVDQTAAWINANSDYIYFGRRMNGNTPPAFVLMAEKPQDFSDGINLLFNDGSVEFRELRWATESLAFTDAQLPPPRPAIAPLSTTITSSTATRATTDASSSKTQRRHHHFPFGF